MPASIGSVEQIKRITCEEFGVLRHELESRRAQKHIATARMIGMALTRRLTRMSLPQIGRWFDRHPSTVLNACRRMDAYLAAAARTLPANAAAEAWVRAMQAVLELPESEGAARPWSRSRSHAREAGADPAGT